MRTILKFVQTGFLLSALILAGCQKRVHIFKDLEGPQASTPLIDSLPIFPEAYDMGSHSQLAVLLISKDSNWLGLARGLKSIGIPFRITEDYESALQHDVVLVYPHISGRDVKLENLQAIRRFVESGGTLIGTNILGGGMADMFGFSDIKENKERYLLDFKPSSVTENFEDQGLSHIKISSAKKNRNNPGTNSYLDPINPAIALYENGEAAIITNDYGQGKTYALGIDIGQMLAKGYNRRQVDIDQYYANHFQPTLDAFLILLENIYKEGQNGAVTLGTVPNAKTLSFILSHDVDYSKSLKNAIAYAEHQQSEDIQATYFIQTKYIKDYNDKVFFDEEGAGFVRELDARGAEIGSHTVAHTQVLWEIPMGTGEERYPSYRPFIRTAQITKNATVLGELRVSKFLLDHFATSRSVESFRPGFLSNPAHMPEALAATGYKYSSSSTANVSLTHLPFQLTYGRGFDTLTPIFEIPITVEDELPPSMITRLEDGKELARKIAKIGGVYVVLIHTDDVDDRLEFQKQMVNEVRPYAWMGSIRQFGDWWSARDQVEIDGVIEDGDLIITIDAPKPIEGLVLEVDKSFKIKDAGVLEVSRVDQGVLIGRISGQHKITLSQ